MHHLPTDADLEHIAIRIFGERPVLAGRDSPTHDQICEQQGPWWAGLPERTRPMTTLQEIPVANLHPRGTNLRVKADGTDLVASIKTEGVLQPLNVSPNGQPGHYWVNAGHRRLDAAKRAKLDSVPCLVDENRQDDTSIAFAMLIENMQRTDLSPVEQARGFERLVDLGVKQKEIAAHVGISTSLVSRRLSLLKLPDGVLDKVHAGDISLELAEQYTKLPDDVATIAADNQWSEWKVDEAVRKQETKRRAAELKAAATDRGITVIPSSKIGKLVPDNPKKEYRYLDGHGSWNAKPVEPSPLELEAAVQRKGFVALTVVEQSSGPVLTAVGTKTSEEWKRPGPDGKPTKRETHEDRWARERAERERKEKHWEQFANQLIGKKVPAAKAQRLMLAALMLEFDMARPACDLLGIDTSLAEADDKLLAEIDAGGARRDKAYLALALGSADGFSGDPHPELVPMLADLGWKPLDPDDGDGES